jgi:hypothetical protein
MTGFAIGSTAFGMGLAAHPIEATIYTRSIYAFKKMIYLIVYIE